MDRSRRAQLSYTQIVGKAYVDGRPKWIVPPQEGIGSVQRLTELLGQCSQRGTYVRVRPDLETWYRKWAGKYPQERASIAKDGTFSIIFRDYDKAWNMMVERDRVTFEVGVPQHLGKQEALYYLDPNTWGLLLEECDRAGKPLYPCGVDESKPSPPKKGKR